MSQRTLCLISLLFLFSGCTLHTPDRLHLLTSLSPDESLFIPEVSIAPVEVRRFLDRPEMIRRSDAHTLTRLETELWGEPLSENVAQVLADNLTRLTGIPVSPARVPGTLLLHVRIEDLTRTAPDRMVFQARYRIEDGPGKHAVSVPFSRTLTIPEGGAGLARGGSEALDALAREIRAALMARE